ncbi:protein CapI [Candidatus Aerophobetes bacterium]|uniref:Protein CapI n=1 Tax=Aerophobetes bacterium TaxID=2030807 RepID=A0A2A4YKP9_UNCAE|nr:MAG: protein CapI [Candidatus Aerophobetes bacterium]
MRTYKPKTIFITGIAGFIGYHLAKALVERGDTVIGCDNFNEYYPVFLKNERVAILKKLGVEVIDHDIRELKSLKYLFEKHSFTHFINLAAQAGVRFSITHPHTYVQCNINGFLEVLEMCREFPSMKLIYASSSSVYGLNEKTPFSEDDLTKKPASLYAATKQSNELMAYVYSHVHGMHTTGLRFFTVYGPMGRPDMAYFSFTRAIDEGKPIHVFNHGKMKRDFTYIDDIIDGCVKAIDFGAKCEIFNLGNNKAEDLSNLIEQIESNLSKKAIIELKPMQPGDVYKTFADITKSQKMLGYAPKVSLEEGMKKFVSWYKEFSHELES